MLLTFLVQSIVLLGSTPKQISAKQFSIANVTIGDSEQAILRTFGNPIIEPEVGISALGDDAPTKDFQFVGVAVHLVGGRVVNLECTSRNFATFNGIRVGDSTSKLLKVYGKGESWTRAEGLFTRFNVRGTDCYLVFRSLNGKIIKMELWFDWT
jgi:hypothetical protein